jgi:putative sigma-54 modulation protein
MKVKIQSLHFDADRKLLDFIDEKVNKLVTFNSSILDAEVILRLENSSTTDNKVVEIKLLVPGPDLFAKRCARPSRRPPTRPLRHCADSSRGRRRRPCREALTRLYNIAIRWGKFSQRIFHARH